MGLESVLEQLPERLTRSSKATADAYHCRPGSFAVIDRPPSDHSLTPETIIADVELAFDRVYVPRLERMLEVDSDHMPDIDLFHGVTMIAGAFGCPVVYTPGEWPWARPVMRSITEVDSLKAPDLRAHDDTQRFFDQVRWIQNKTDGRVPIRLHDLQSPFTTAAQMRGFEGLLTDVLIDPDRVRKLMEIITDVSLQFLELQDDVFEAAAYPGRNFPCVLENMGVCIADDSAAIPLSPEQYEEFCLPDMLRIAEAVPGLFYHSCGDYSHQTDNLLKIPNLRAIQMHTGPGEVDSLPAWRKIRGRVALWSDTNDVGLGDQYRDDYWSCYEEYVLPRLFEGKRDGLVLLSPTADTPQER